MPKTVSFIFSKDRPMQLDALLQSIFLHCQDVKSIDVKVLWLCSNNTLKQQYHELIRIYPMVEFISQSNFSMQVAAVLKDYEYVLFLVDDNIFVRDFSISNIIKSLNMHHDALGFSLRLGRNTNYCYPLNVSQKLPHFISIECDYLKFDWTLAEYDFGYPLEISSSVYRVTDILTAITNDFINPNMLEMQLSNNKMLFQEKKYLLCPTCSYGFCIPVNRVQNTFANRVGESPGYSIEVLTELFIKGYRVDITKYSGFISNACHQEVKLHFITRSAEKPAAQSDAAPLVSVIMPVYNAEQFLREAILSILQQTFSDFEFIIIDDGSTDNSPIIIESFIDPRLVVVRNETNLKLIASLNKGIKLARGKYIARMDADDISLPERLEKQVNYMEQHPEVAVLGTGIELFGCCEKRLGRYTDNPEIAKCVLIFGCCAAHPTVMLRNSVLAAGYFYSPLYPHAEDYALWVQIAKNHQITNLSETLLKYRISPDQISSKFAKEQMEATIKIQMEQIHALGITPTGQELSLHWLISKKQFLPAAFIPAALEWLKKLKTANAAYKYFPEQAFTEVLGSYWKSICQNLLKAF